MIHIRVTHPDGRVVSARGATLADAVQHAARQLGLTPGGTRGAMPATLAVGDSCSWMWGQRRAVTELRVERIAAPRASGASISHTDRLKSGERQERLYLTRPDQEILDWLALLDGSRAEAIRVAIRERYARLLKK